MIPLAILAALAAMTPPSTWAKGLLCIHPGSAADSAASSTRNSRNALMRGD